MKSMTLFKQNLTGMGYVLRFSFVQLLKAKGNIISLCIFMLLALVSVPVMSVFSPDSSVPAPEPDYEYAQAHEAQRLSVSYSIVSHSEYLGGGDSLDGAGYLVQIAYSVLVMVISMMSVSYIIGAVAEEKTSKLVELLMVSVKPLALIAGKIISVMLYMLMTVALIALCFALSNALSAVFLGSSVSFFAGADLPGIIGAGNILAVLVSLLLGCLTFAIAAGLFGAGCSSTEDIQSAAGGCTIVIMLAYLASVVAGALGGTVSTVCSLIPVLSVFCAPVQYALGGLSLPLLCLSWIIQAGCVALLALLCARIYAMLLIYRGSRVGLRQMLSMARVSGREAV